jgi:DNA adenine methylase
MVSNDLDSNSAVNEVRPLQPLIRWAGSKRSILQRLAPHVPSTFGRYIEPFAGSACLYFNFRPVAALLADKNAELIDTYKAVRRQPCEIWSFVTSLPRNKATYYALRAVSPLELDQCSRAVRFLYLNRLCFNGIYRTNRAGAFNVPIGSKTGAFPDLSSFASSAQLLRTASLWEADFEETVAAARKNDFVYIDPPYVDSRRIDRNEYGEGSFSPADIGRLFIALEAAHRRGVKFLLSYSDTLDFRDLLPDQKKLRRIRVKRRIGCDVLQRKGSFELLLKNQDVF